MNSVYPGGIRWQNLEMGPIARADSDRSGASMPAIIERADNRATRMFATGFGFAMIMLMLPLAMLVVLACSLLFDGFTGPGHTMQVFGSVIAMVLLPWASARVLDRRLGGRIAPAGRLGRLLAAVLGFYARLGMGRGSNKLVALLVSHDGRARAGLAGLMIIIPVMAVLLVQSSIAKGRLPLAFFIGLSTEDPYSPNTSPAALYAGSGEQRFSVLHLPHVSSRVVQGPYLELFMPFIPRLHGPALQASRPGALTVTREPEASAGRLECLAQLADIRIDGAALGLRLDATSDPETGQPVMLAMLPVSALAPGRHEVSLNAPTRGDGNAQAPRRYRIPFWK